MGNDGNRIIGRTPSWMTRWGSTLLLLIVLLFIIGCYLIKLPEIYVADVILSSDTPPTNLVCRSSGLVDTLFVTNGAQVLEGEVVAVISSTANYLDITRVKSVIHNNASLYDIVSEVLLLEEINLGDLQKDWLSLVSVCSNYMDNQSIAPQRRRIESLRELLILSESNYSNALRRRTLLEEDYRLVKKSFYRDSLLHQRHVMSDEEYEQACRSLLSKEIALADNESLLLECQQEIANNKRLIQEATIEMENNELNFDNIIRQAVELLGSQLSLWEEKYLIVSPYNGTISFQSIWSKGQYVHSGEVFASIVPGNEGNVRGIMHVTSNGIGHVKVGQVVNIKANGFPFIEYGIVKGTIESFSSMPEAYNNDISYVVYVSLPDGLKTSYGKTLPLVQRMSGEADIVLYERRIIDHFIQPIKSLIVNH